jgi:hypothetical protein
MQAFSLPPLHESLRVISHGLEVSPIFPVQGLNKRSSPGDLEEQQTKKRRISDVTHNVGIKNLNSIGEASWLRPLSESLKDLTRELDVAEAYHNTALPPQRNVVYIKASVRKKNGKRTPVVIPNHRLKLKILCAGISKLSRQEPDTVTKGVCSQLELVHVIPQENMPPAQRISLGKITEIATVTTRQCKVPNGISFNPDEISFKMDIVLSEDIPTTDNGYYNLEIANTGVPVFEGAVFLDSSYRTKEKAMDFLRQDRAQKLLSALSWYKKWCSKFLVSTPPLLASDSPLLAFPLKPSTHTKNNVFRGVVGCFNDLKLRMLWRNSKSLNMSEADYKGIKENWLSMLNLVEVTRDNAGNVRKKSLGKFQDFARRWFVEENQKEPKKKFFTFSFRLKEIKNASPKAYYNLEFPDFSVPLFEGILYIGENRKILKNLDTFLESADIELLMKEIKWYQTWKIGLLSLETNNSEIT